MKIKHLSVALLPVLIAGGLWLAWPAWRSPGSQKSSIGPGSSARASQTGPERVRTNGPDVGHMLSAPDPTRRFMEFTPEQRVQFARQGHGPGG
ncbi:MAG TPA: hypothetical protein VKY92_24890 [Verrucomicrobiae bacterium]|nr:hypothetical protein [Verrucomicrobiae bacterium]